MPTSIDTDRFSLMYAEQRGRVFGILLKSTRNPAIAEDLAQDAFLRAWAAWPGYRADGTPVGAWLCRIAHRVAVDWYRREQVRWAALPALAAAQGTEASPEAAVVARVSGADAAGYLARLSPARRRIVLLRAAGFTDREIGARLGLSANAVKSRAFQARAQCRAWRAQEEGEA